MSGYIIAQIEVKNPENEEFDYVLMTNRILIKKDKNIKNCFDNFYGEDLVTVKRNGLVLSTLRKIKK